MDSSASRRLEEERRQAELRRQIAALQAQLQDVPEEPQASPAPALSTPKKRKQAEQNLLAPATPSPKKRRREEEQQHARGPKALSVPLPKALTAKQSLAHPSLVHKSLTMDDTKQAGPSSQPARSNVLSKLAGFASASTATTPKNTISRSTGFTEKPAVKPESDAAREDGGSGNRDENMTVIEDLDIGPYDHKPPFDDPHLKKLEPHSGIRLSSRALPHDEFQDYLRGRYYLSPSKLYSVIRLLPNKQGYDVPVEGDWVTIAVVAERGPLRYTKAPVGVGKDDAAGLADEESDIKSLALDAPPPSQHAARPGFQRWKGKAPQEPPRPTGKKYMNLKLIDFGCRTKSSASAGKAVIRGDAFLSLLLFESDRVEEVVREDGKKEKMYRGGSKGAFERLSKLKEGAVVALLNPKILKPFQRSGDAPHPTDNILAITPESHESVLVLGHSQDLGMCHVVKRDGKVCGGWCDKRVSDVCDYHIQHAVQQKRAARAEFSSGTSGMTAFAKKKLAYDPARQWGLKPETDSAAPGATYVVSGHVVSDRREPSGLFVHENMGRDAQAKAARKVSAREADRTLETLLKRDKDGARAVKAAREFGRKMKEREEEYEGKGAKRSRKGKEKEKQRKRKKDENEEDREEEEEAEKPVKNAYSATLVRNIGFDPTAKDGRKVKDSEVQRKLETLAAVSARKEIELGPRPGKLKTTVRAPDKPEDSVSHDYPSSDDDDLYIEPPNPGPPSSEPPMVDLDSSDTEA